MIEYGRTTKVKHSMRDIQVIYPLQKSTVDQTVSSFKWVGVIKDKERSPKPNTVTSVEKV